LADNNYSNGNGNGIDEDVIDLRVYLQVLKKRWKLILQVTSLPGINMIKYTILMNIRGWHSNFIIYWPCFLITWPHIHPCRTCRLQRFAASIQGFLLPRPVEVW
jgi:hypothetical protein